MRFFYSYTTFVVSFAMKSLALFPFSSSTHSAAVVCKACEYAPPGKAAGWSHRALPSPTLQQASWKLLLPLLQPLQPLQI